MSDYLQSLIADLDSLLSQENPRFSWSKLTDSGERESKHQILQRVRDYLVSLHQQTVLSNPVTSESHHSHCEGGEREVNPSVPGKNTPRSNLPPKEQETVEQIAQVVISQMTSRLTDWLDSLQGELAQLRQQRSSLLTEIQHLQQQRQQIMADFLEVLLSRCNEVLQEHKTQTWDTLESQLRQRVATTVNPSDILQQLLHIQQQSDRLLMTLDSTFRTVFETLEKDLQGYYESLSQGLEKMHGLGQQGEVKFIAYLNRLAQHLETQNPPLPLVESSKSSPEQPIEKITKLTDLLEIDFQKPEKTFKLGWYLGIDLGTTGLSAVLQNTSVSKNASSSLPHYPLYWSSDNEVSFRFPAIADDYLFQQNLPIPPSPPSPPSPPVSSIQNGFSDPSLAAVGLSDISLKQALNQLQGVIVSYSPQKGQTFCDSLKRAILQEQLVQSSEQIFFLEAAIASLMAELPLESDSSVTNLVIHQGATATEFALVELPPERQNLRREDFTLDSLAYGGNELDQDIFCQLIYPQWISHHPTFPKLEIEFPQPGKAESDKRVHLRQSLTHNHLGSSFLEAARLAKLILQQEEQFTSQLGERNWGVNRQSLVEKVIYPFILDLEDRLNSLLRQRGISELAIAQILCSGGSFLAMSHTLLPWLAEKFPQATIIYPTEEEASTRVALGLARLPLFPNFVK
jgi:hypothetical protein